MARFVRILCILWVAALATACGDDTQFRVTGTVEGLGTRYIYMLYTADGAVHREQVAAIDGKFDLYGTSPDYTVVELFHRPDVPVGRLVAKNGETLKCRLDIDSPYVAQVKGNRPSEEWARWTREHARMLRGGSAAEIDSAVAEYIHANPSNLVSTLLLLTVYRPADREVEAARLLAEIAPKARPEKLVADYQAQLAYINTAAVEQRLSSFTLWSYGDSMERLNPSRHKLTVVAFTGEPRQRRDTIVSILSPLAGDSTLGRRLKIVEVGCDPDSAAWRRSMRSVPAPWTAVWTPLGPADTRFEELEVARLPYFIAADSAGHIIYRGGSASAVARLAEKRLRVKSTR